MVRTALTLSAAASCVGQRAQDAGTVNVTRCLGHGVYGAVFSAQSSKWGEVALKVELNRGKHRSSQTLFEEESRVMHLLGTHDNVVHLLGNSKIPLASFAAVNNNDPVWSATSPSRYGSEPGSCYQALPAPNKVTGASDQHLLGIITEQFAHGTLSTLGDALEVLSGFTNKTNQSRESNDPCRLHAQLAALRHAAALPNGSLAVRTLASFADQNADAAWGVLVDVASAMEHIHGLGLVHGDLCDLGTHFMMREAAQQHPGTASAVAVLHDFGLSARIFKLAEQERQWDVHTTSWELWQKASPTVQERTRSLMTTAAEQRTSNGAPSSPYRYERWRFVVGVYGQLVDTYYIGQLLQFLCYGTYSCAGDAEDNCKALVALQAQAAWHLSTNVRPDQLRRSHQQLSGADLLSHIASIDSHHDRFTLDVIRRLHNRCARPDAFDDLMLSLWAPAVQAGLVVRTWLAHKGSNATEPADVMSVLERSAEAATQAWHPIRSWQSIAKRLRGLRATRTPIFAPVGPCRSAVI